MSDTYMTRFGLHCTHCGSLVGSCKDQAKCREDAAFHIEKAIRSGSEDHPLLETAHRLFGETVLSLRGKR